MSKSPSPANVANVASKSTTVVVVENVETVDAPALSVAERLAVAVAAVSVAADGDDNARAALASVVIEAYALHAGRYAVSVTRDGVTRDVLPDNLRRDVAARVWRDATGDATPPAATDRTPGEKSLAQYVARYGTVATNDAHGIGALNDTATAAKSYKSISDTKSAAKKQADRAVASADAREFVAWRDSLPTADRAAIERAARLFTENSVGRTHAPAFVATLTA